MRNRYLNIHNSLDINTMSFRNTAVFSSATGTSAAGVHRAWTATDFASAYSTQAHDSQGIIQQQQHLDCFLCSDNISFAKLVPSSVTSRNHNVTVYDLVAGLNLFFQNAQFQRKPCHTCKVLNKLSLFLTSLIELQGCISEVKGHVDSQLAVEQQERLAQLQGTSWDSL